MEDINRMTDFLETLKAVSLQEPPRDETATWTAWRRLLLIDWKPDLADETGQSGHWRMLPAGTAVLKALEAQGPDVI